VHPRAETGPGTVSEYSKGSPTTGRGRSGKLGSVDSYNSRKFCLSLTTPTYHPEVMISSVRVNESSRASRSTETTRRAEQESSTVRPTGTP